MTRAELKHKKSRRHREMILMATVVVIAGTLLGFSGFHGLGVIVEVLGLIAVALV